jgi:lysophospholipase L1-like esterase
MARMLAERTGVPCVLTNLAADGASVGVVVERQLPVLAGLAPDLVSVTVGMNDIRDPDFDAARFGAGLDRLLDGVCQTGATVLTCTLPDISGMIPLAAELVAVARGRMAAASEVIRERAGRHGAVCLDLWQMPQVCDPGLFGPDRIHPNPAGHQLMAVTFADLLLG